ncbi:MAG: sigma-70 family RNA polymerase sigma factor [Clostridia bacterium]|nr:sigma-70 family RNA polymerase sigma factor [Clostridia bacterium]
MNNGESSYRRFLDGDEAAFEEIVRTYREGLIFFTQRIVGDEMTAEDIAIDVFADVLMHRYRYHFKVSLKTYLYTLARSRAIDHIRRKKRFGTVSLSDAEYEISDTDSPEDTVFSDEQKERVHLALRQLPEDMRLAVHLIYFEELSYEETAKIMKKTKKQVDNLLYRAKNLLRSIIGKEGIL